MYRKLAIIAALFIAVRCLTIVAYRDTAYYYGMVANQFAIADASYRGHTFSYDAVRVEAVQTASNSSQRYIPLEAWSSFPRSGQLRTFPAQDVPGFGYLIAFTSRLFDRSLTSLYAFGVQLAAELISLLIFIYCIHRILGERIAFLSGIIYLAAYAFIWPIASQPMRDIFIMGTFSCYLAAFFLVTRRSGFPAFLAILGLVGLSAVLLWIRPSGYYFFFFVSPAIFFIKSIPWKSRLSFFFTTILLPVLIFSVPFAQFNRKHYATSDTDLIGRALWEGMGVVRDNPYGFVLHDGALVPWIKQHYGKDVEYSSPKMNKLLGEYARSVIRQDPLFYAKTVLTRGTIMVMTPLTITAPRLLNITGYMQSGLSLSDYAKMHPIGFFYTAVSMTYSFFFFHVGLILAIAMVVRLNLIRVELMVLLSPLFYTLATQIPLHFEPRYLATGAWVLVLPFAWYADRLIRKRSTRDCAE